MTIYDLRLQPDIKKATLRLETLAKQKRVIELKAKNKQRTLNQNAYFHVCCGRFGLELGYTIEESKVIFKRAYGLYYVKNGIKFLKSTTELDVKEKSKFTEFILIWSAQEHGIFIPTPEEYRENSFKYDQEVEKFEEFLGGRK